MASCFPKTSQKLSKNRSYYAAIKILKFYFCKNLKVTKKKLKIFFKKYFFKNFNKKIQVFFIQIWITPTGKKKKVNACKSKLLKKLIKKFVNTKKKSFRKILVLREFLVLSIPN